MKEVKLSLITYNMTAYLKKILWNPEKCYGKSDFSNVLRHKLNIQKSIVFIYFSNKELETENSCTTYNSFKKVKSLALI